MKRVQQCVLPPERREREQSRGRLSLSFPTEFSLGYIETGHCSEVQLLVAGVCKWPGLARQTHGLRASVGVPTSDTATQDSLVISHASQPGAVWECQGHV